MLKRANLAPVAATPAPTAASGGAPLNAPLAGNIFKVKVSVGQQINAGDVVIILEAMKMETEVRATTSGTITAIAVKEGDAVQSGQPLLTVG